MPLPPDIEAKLIELGRQPGEGDGYQITVPLDYSIPEPLPFPREVTLTAPPATEVWQICARVKAEDSQAMFLFFCLPVALKDGLFFNFLTEPCKHEVVRLAMELVLGESLAHYFFATVARLNEERKGGTPDAH